MSEEQERKELKFALGGIIISLPLSGKTKFGLESSYHPFFISFGQPTVVLYSHHGPLPRYDFNEPIFEANGFWRIYQTNGKLIFWQTSGLYSPNLGYKLITLDSNFTSGEIYIRPIKPNSNSLIYLLDNPLDKILIVSLLSLNQGMLIHACGVKYQGEGFLFIGPSGSGKSTLANLYKDKKDVTILNDEFVILKKKGKTFFIYGTPWSGTAQTFSPESVPLSKIFFIKHDCRNTLVFKKEVEISSSLLSHSLRPSWHRPGMESVLGLGEELSKSIPAYELGFVPDKSALDFIMGA